jgi:hypothetical protein
MDCQNKNIIDFAHITGTYAVCRVQASQSMQSEPE